MDGRACPPPVGVAQPSSTRTAMRWNSPIFPIHDRPEHQVETRARIRLPLRIAVFMASPRTASPPYHSNLRPNLGHRHDPCLFLPSPRKAFAKENDCRQSREACDPKGEEASQAAYRVTGDAKRRLCTRSAPDLRRCPRHLGTVPHAVLCLASSTRAIHGDVVVDQQTLPDSRHVRNSYCS